MSRNLLHRKLMFQLAFQLQFYFFLHPATIHHVSGILLQRHSDDLPGVSDNRNTVDDTGRRVVHLGSRLVL